MIHVLVCKGEGLATEEMSMRSAEKVRASFGDTQSGQSIGLEVLPNGPIALRVTKNLNSLTTPQETIFEGTLEDLISKLGDPDEAV